MKTSPLHLGDLEILGNVPNADYVLSRIEFAAQRATVAMQALGVRLTDDAYPSYDAVLGHLRGLVKHALHAYLVAMSDNPGADVDGEAGCDQFEVWVSRSDDGRGLHIEFAMYLS